MLSSILVNAGIETTITYAPSDAEWLGAYSENLGNDIYHNYKIVIPYLHSGNTDFEKVVVVVVKEGSSTENITSIPKFKRKYLGIVTAKDKYFHVFVYPESVIPE